MRRMRTVVAAMMAAATLGAVSCTPSTLPDGSVPQDVPFGVNGLTEEDGTVWVADLFAGQLVRFSPDSGRILERYGRMDGLCGTDDLVVTADRTLVATCPVDGRVIAVERGGRARVLDAVGRSVNPIALDPSGEAVLVGFGSEDDDRVLRVFLDGRPTEVVADDLPVLNGFDVGPDGRLYAPTGGAAGSFGTGGLGRLDLATGAFEQLPLTFPGTTRTGFDFACGVDVVADGTVFVAQCFNPSVYAVDPDTGVATLVGRAPLDTADNLVVLDDGRVVLSGFFGGKVVVFDPDGAGGWSRRSLTVGR
jgi:outer membrane protein assembly factor BamB